MAQGAGEAVAERGLLRGQAGGVEFQARAGDAGEGGELIGVVPDQAEKRADLVDEAGGGRAAAAVFQGGEIGGGDQERGGHVALADAAGGAQGAEFFAEGGHEVRKRSLFCKKAPQKTFDSRGTGKQPV